jgi:uncharacterized protein (DUF2141 family)
MKVKSRSIHAALSALTLVGAGISGAAWAVPASAQLREEVTNNPQNCARGSSVRITVSDIKPGGGTLRVQLYRGTKADWLVKGHWIHRIEVPARASSMSICMPVPQAGTYGIAIRHDVNGNGKTDISEDGGGMSNNPSINIFNLGKPSFDKTAFQVGNAPTSLNIRMRYF